MNRLHKTLVVLLAAQVGLAAWTWRPGSQAAVQAKPLLGLDRDSITELDISGAPKDGKEPDPVRLVRKGEDWTIASSQDYPADPAKVGELLDRLEGLQAGRPIATHDSAHDELKVSKEHHDRHVVVKAGENSVELYLGAATSRSVNARRLDQDQVYEGHGFSTWSIGDGARQYYDPVYVQADVDELGSFELDNSHGSLHLSKDGDHWTLAELPEGARLDEDAAKNLVERLVKLRMSEPSGKEVRPEYGLDGGVRVSWTIEEGDQSIPGGYRVGAEDDKKLYVQADGNPFVVKVSRYSLAKALDTTLEDLVESP